MPHILSAVPDHGKAGGFGARGHRDFGAGLGGRQGHRAAEAPAGTGDDGDLAYS